MPKLTKRLSIALALASVAVLPPAFGQRSLDSAARDIDRAESLRAVKRLQRTYAQYSQYGLWNEMAELFASDGALILGDRSAQGRKAIAELLTKRSGADRQGLGPGAIHTQLIDEPVVNLSTDGRSAKGRWYGFFLLSDAKGNASIEGGVFENAYVRRQGEWKIAVLHFYPQYAGAYATGWKNWKGRDLPIVPYHYTPDESGVPIPAPAGPPPHSKATLADLEARVDELDDEDLVRNLQAAYGYYVDRRMWDDVIDLFADDGVCEIGGVGVYVGHEGVRKALQRMGPAGLTHGVLNDRLQFDTVVNVAPGRHEARVRGIELGMLGEAAKGTAYWTVAVFDNRFVNEDGLWKIREMRVFPLFRSNYKQGWGKSRIVEGPPKGALAPDKPLPAADAGREDRIIPKFISAHPVTGEPVTAPAGFRLVATEALTGPIAASHPKNASAEAAARLAEVARKLAVAEAYDGAENVSSAYGQYIDDFQWPQMAALFGKRGAKQVPFAGYYIGARRIAHATYLEWGDPQKTRAGVALHWRIQPVINVAPDGRSARLRTYLFHPNVSKRGGTLFGAMYPDDHLILEDGVWRLWNLSLDEPYFSMPNWKGGWSAAKERPSAAPRPKPPSSRAAKAGPKHYIGAALVEHFPPDVPINVLGARQAHFRGGTGVPWEWPKILPMWWGYRNPVSGRTPEHFLPDCVPCDYAPDLSMARHGYLLPPTDPVRSAP